MKLLERARPKTLRIVFTVLTLYTALYCGYEFYNSFFVRRFSNDQCLWVEQKVNGINRLAIKEILPGGVVDRAGILDGDTLIAINGDTVTSAFQAQAILNRFSEDDEVIYTVLRQAQTLNFSMTITKPLSPVYLSFALLGFAFLINGWIVITSRPNDRIPQGFFFMSLFAALFFIINTEFFGLNVAPTKPWLVHALVSVIVFPSSFITFFCFFPKTKFKTWVRRTVISVSLATSIIASLIGLRNYQATGNLSGVDLLISFGAVGVGLGFFIHSFFRIKDPVLRRPLKSILLGAGLGILGFAYLIVAPIFVPIIFINYPEFLIPVGLVVAIPISFGYSIFRHRLMDIEIIIKKSLVYGATTASLAVLYLSVIFLVSLSLRGWSDSVMEQGVVQFIFLLGAAVVFAPMKDWIQEFIDRKFFREKYDYQKALRQFSTDLPSLTRLDDIMDRMVTTLSATMHISRMAVVLYEEKINHPVLYRSTGMNGQGQLDRDSDIVMRLAESKQPLLLAHPHGPAFVLPGVQLAVPMTKRDDLIGVMLLGPKLSEKAFSEEDMDLLATVGSQAAIAIENARLIKEEMEKAKLENELQVARRIQQSLLPQTSPQLAGLELAGVSVPAMSVGGDYFDTIQLDDHRVLVAIADVSGKGVSAALYMSKIQGMIQMASRLYDSPRSMLIEVNDWMFRSMERQSFVTIALAMVDVEKQTMTVCRAGHSPPLAIEESLPHVIQCRGIGVGLAAGTLFDKHLDEEVVPLRIGMQFIFYTDGITEAMDVRREEFGEDRLMSIIRSQVGQSPKRLIDEVLDRVRQFAGKAEQHDDMTLVVVKVTK